MAAKSRAAELRLPMRRFIEEALANAISGDNALGMDSPDATPLKSLRPSVWEDQYIGAQANQPLGAPLDLSEGEARRVALQAFDFQDDSAGPFVDDQREDLEVRARGQVGDPVNLSDEDAAQIARDALMFGTPGVGRTVNG